MVRSALQVDATRIRKSPRENLLRDRCERNEKENPAMTLLPNHLDALCRRATPAGMRIGSTRLLGARSKHSSIVMAAVLAVSLALVSNARADGPPFNYGTRLCFQPQGNGTTQGTLIVQMPCEVDAASEALNPFQQWSMQCKVWKNKNENECDVFHYVNVGSGLCMRARGPNGPANGLHIMLWPCNEISDLLWSQVDGLPLSDPLITDPFVLESRLGRTTGYCLDVPGGSSEVGLPLQLYRCNQTPAQMWTYTRIFR